MDTSPPSRHSRLELVRKATLSDSCLHKLARKLINCPTMEIFDHLDPDMPAAPVSAAQVHEWFYKNIVISLENNAEKVMAKENGHSNALDADVTMTDAIRDLVSYTLQHSPTKCCTAENQRLFWGVAFNTAFRASLWKTLVLWNMLKIPFLHLPAYYCSWEVLNCHDSVIYLLAPLKYAIVYGCSDATVILGAIGKAVREENCDRVQVIAASKRICIANCRECVFIWALINNLLFLGIIINYKNCCNYTVLLLVKSKKLIKICSSLLIILRA
ncbi:hypothetical protein HPP92_027525, partial [Vanilla planifolia]